MRVNLNNPFLWRQRQSYQENLNATPERDVVGFKLLRLRSDGTVGPLFVNRGLVIQPGEWYRAEAHHPTGKLKFRPGWHVCRAPVAPHLSSTKLRREWWRVAMRDVAIIPRPAHQGGDWYLAKHMKLVERVDAPTC